MMNVFLYVLRKIKHYPVILLTLIWNISLHCIFLH